MTASKAYDPAFAWGVVELGREGLSRAEIAARIGVPIATLEAWAADQPALAEGLALADTEARAWWDRQPREALRGGESFRSTLWAKVMAQRYGSAIRRARPDPEADESGAEAAAASARVELPRNGREARPRVPSAGRG